MTQVDSSFETTDFKDFEKDTVRSNVRKGFKARNELLQWLISLRY
jgi:hypothetical protein